MFFSSMNLLAMYLISAVAAEDILMLQRYENASINSCTGQPSLEYSTSIDAGYSIKLVTDDEWTAMGPDDFSQFKAIVIPDCCLYGSAQYDILENNRGNWSAAVDANIILLGTDPDVHAGDNPGAKTLIEDTIGFVANHTFGTTGLYVAFGFAYYDVDDAEVVLLSEFGSFHFAQIPSCEVHIVASSPALGTLADSDIQNWRCSAHEMFTVYPSTGLGAFIPLAIIDDATGPGAMSFSDGSSGVPYILSRGTTPAGCGDGTWNAELGEECDDGNKNDGDGCSSACKCESGLPDGSGGCLPPPYHGPSTTYTSPASTTAATASSNTFSKVIFTNSSTSPAATEAPVSTSGGTPVSPVATSPGSSWSISTSASSSPSTPKPSSGPGFILSWTYDRSRGGKRQTSISYGYINDAGHVAATSDCNVASLFSIDDTGRLTSDSLVAYTNATGVTSGSSAFTFGVSSPYAQIETTFAISGSTIGWTNILFSNPMAIFAVDLDSGLVTVFYKGVPSVGYQILTFTTIVGGTVQEACDANQNPTTTGVVPAVPTPIVEYIIIGVEVFIQIDIRITVNFVGQVPVSSLITNTRNPITRPIYNTAIPGVTCYKCLLEAEGITCPSDTLFTITQTVVRDCDHTPSPAPIVFKACPVCEAITLTGTAPIPSAPATRNVIVGTVATAATTGGLGKIGPYVSATPLPPFVNDAGRTEGMIVVSFAAFIAVLGLFVL